MPRFLAFKAQKDAEIRTETFLGREHVVVPVVALVEGVVQGLSAPAPELALASEFGKVPQGWDGRPVVMNHPVIDGHPVSANSPTVMESFTFGRLFNTQVEDGKLKTEAWIDVARAKELGGEFQSTLDRLKDNKIVEVSTGLFCDTEKTAGKFNGKDYVNIWRSVVPDHLALLSEGTKGACSVDSGCGTPRSNEQAEIRVNNADLVAAKADFAILDCGCGNGEQPAVLEEPVLITNKVADGILSTDVRKIINNGLKSLDASAMFYAIGFTASKAIYERFNPQTGEFKIYQRSFNISSDFKVKFGEDETEVNLFVQIVPAEGSNVKANKENPAMADNPKPTATPAAATAGATETPKAPETPATPVVAAAPATPAPAAPAVEVRVEAPTPKTLEQLLKEASPELRDTISAGVKLHQQRKDTIIKALKETGRCKFSDEALKAMSLDELQNLSELAAIPSFEGLASRTEHLQDGANDQPAPIAVFPIKPVAAAA